MSKNLITKDLTILFFIVSNTIYNSYTNRLNQALNEKMITHLTNLISQSDQKFDNMFFIILNRLDKLEEIKEATNSKTLFDSFKSIWNTTTTFLYENPEIIVGGICILVIAYLLYNGVIGDIKDVILGIDEKESTNGSEGGTSVSGNGGETPISGNGGETPISSNGGETPISSNGGETPISSNGGENFPLEPDQGVMIFKWKAPKGYIPGDLNKTDASVVHDTDANCPTVPEVLDITQNQIDQILDICCDFADSISKL